MKITSRKNPTVLLYRTLLRNAAARRGHNLFVAEGEKLCTEAINAGLVPASALFSEQAVKKYAEFYDKISQSTVVYEINGGLSEYISDTKTPQGVFAAFPVLDKSVNFDKIYKCNRVIILDRLQDPGNIGTIIRSADAFGIDAIITSRDTADLYSPKVLRSAAGSAFRLPVYTADLCSTVPALKQNGFSVYAAIVSKSAEKLGEIAFPSKTAVIIGNEGGGISDTLLPLCNSLYIPITGAESLNAAVAASLIIYEMRKS